MAIEARALKRSRTKTERTGARSIPKMGLNRRSRPNKPKAQLPKYSTLVSLIKALGEFDLITDASGTVVGFWASRRPRYGRQFKTVVGTRLDTLVEAPVASEIQTLVGLTAARGRREELKFRVTVRGVQRSFSICAVPLGLNESGVSAFCLAVRDVTDRVEAIRTVAEREAFLAKVEEIANFGSWEMDLKTNAVALSAQLTKIYELSPREKWSRETYWERMHPNDRLRVRRLTSKALTDGRAVEYVARYCAHDGRVRVHLAHLLPLLDENGKVIRAMGVIQDVTGHADSDQELRRLSQQIMNEQDNQRRHLARELHESAGQSLAALKMTLGQLREAMSENPELAPSLLESAALLADSTVREVRTVTYLLHPPMLDDAGLGPALRWYTKGFAERSGICATLELSEPFPRYSQEIETTVFRVVQEALTNVHRYSGSSCAEIKLWHERSTLLIEIRDRGCGFPPAADPLERAKLGVGISGMRERVEQLDGEFEVNSIPGKGTTVRVALPTAALHGLAQGPRTSSAFRP